jgi:hypothetical protein
MMMMMSAEARTGGAHRAALVIVRVITAEAGDQL